MLHIIKVYVGEPQITVRCTYHIGRDRSVPRMQIPSSIETHKLYNSLTSLKVSDITVQIDISINFKYNKTSLKDSYIILLRIVSEDLQCYKLLVDKLIK